MTWLYRCKVHVLDWPAINLDVTSIENLQYFAKVLSRPSFPCMLSGKREITFVLCQVCQILFIYYRQFTSVTSSVHHFSSFFTDSLLPMLKYAEFSANSSLGITCQWKPSHLWHFVNSNKERNWKRSCLLFVDTNLVNGLSQVTELLYFPLRIIRHGLEICEK